MSAPRRLGRLAAATLLLVLAAACGRKGPLYLPDQGAEVVTRPVATPPATTPASPPPADAERKKDPGATPAPR